MKNEEKITRFIPEINKGLPLDQVEERKQLGLVNKTRIVVGKTYLEIIFSDVFSFFNVLLFVVAGLMIAAQYWVGLTFMVVLVANIVISLVQDIRARHTMSKLRVLTQPKVKVIRAGETIVIKNDEIVLDDLILLEASDQICVDGEVLEGSLLVNESALTGESNNITKVKGDKLYSGSYVVSGSAQMYARTIGEESYVETIQAKARAFRRSPSMILKSLTWMFKVIGSIVVTLAIAVAIVYSVKGRFSDYELFKESMKGISGAMIGMIPAGLFLLTSVALAVAVIKLSKKGAKVQDFYSVEMLARSNILCVDKTGTITDGEMDLKKVVILETSTYKDEDIAQIMSNLLKATKDSNFTAKSLQKSFNYELTKGVTDVISFNSETKYSAASFKGGDTFVLGAPECVLTKSVSTLNRRIEEYTSLGLRVLLLAKAGGIKNSKIVGEAKPIALLILEDHIRDDAVETFKWFKDNGVQIKVISGDDPVTVSHIASLAGIDNADKYVSLFNMSDDEVRKAAFEYNVFGRVTPEQKEILVLALKEKGNTVAMTGDGVNDILALKRADCSIAMNSGSDAAKNVSHVVLMDSNFASLPSVVGEGRRVINNLQRTSSLFLVKTMFTMTTTLIFLITLATINYGFPFEATHFQLWSLINIGLAAFFLALENNNEKISGSFLKSVFRKAIPGAIAVLVPVGLMYLAYAFHHYNIMYTGVFSPQNAATMSVISFTVVGLAILAKICLPFNKYRGLVFGGATLLEAGLLVGAGFVSYKVGVKESIIAIDFPSLTLVNWLAIVIIVILTISIYLIASYIVEVFKGEHLDVKNK